MATQITKFLVDNKATIIKRTIVTSAVIVGVTLAAGLFKVVPTEEGAALAASAAKTTTRAARTAAKAAE